MASRHLQRTEHKQLMRIKACLSHSTSSNMHQMPAEAPQKPSASTCLIPKPDASG